MTDKKPKKERDEKPTEATAAPQEVSYYDMLKNSDVVSWLEPLRRKHGWRWRPGDLKLELRSGVAPVLPWHYTVSGKQDCFIWTNLMFDNMGSKSSFQFIPEYCHGCYKVVARPKTVVQLFAIEKLQMELGRPAKCGIEVRDYTPALYGAYWYNRGVEAGRECYKAVREAIDNDPILGPEIDVYLKHACTEMERKYGDSDKWDEITDEQREIEKLIQEHIVYDPTLQDQPQHFLRHTHRRWIEWAFQHGDESYMVFTGGKPLERPPVTYHEEETDNG
jgi:hypothetical protein